MHTRRSPAAAPTAAAPFPVPRAGCHHRVDSARSSFRSVSRRVVIPKTLSSLREDELASGDEDRALVAVSLDDTMMFAMDLSSE